MSSTVRLATLAAALGVFKNAQTPKEGPSSSAAPQNLLSLDFTSNGRRVVARVGEQIELTLGTVGPQQYDEPLISSPAIKLQGTALKWPPNPGGPTFIYIFEAEAEGEVQIKVPIINSGDPDLIRKLTFSVTIRVGPHTGNLTTLHTTLIPDQANKELWKNGWMNVIKVLRQSFVPSLPKLTGVEVELVGAQPGSGTGEITMSISNEKRESLAVVSKTVSVSECRHVLFLLPGGGLQVSPGQFYSIQLAGGDGLFGWKYVIVGHANRTTPRKDGAPSPDFLFQTFGTN